jgi:hypothetical protein
MTHAPAPGRITQTRIALLPDGQIAEAALDATRNAWARWHDGSAWTAWTMVAAGAADVAVAAAVVDGAPAAYVAATPGAPAVGRASRERGIHKLSPDGSVTATAL